MLLHDRHEFAVAANHGFQDRHRVPGGPQTIRVQPRLFRPVLGRCELSGPSHGLSKADIRKVIDIQLRSLLKRLEERKIVLQMTDAARDLLVEEGYDPVYGARPLKRTLQRRVLDPLAMGVLQGDFKEGDTVLADAADGHVALRRRT